MKNKCIYRTILVVLVFALLLSTCGCGAGKYDKVLAAVKEELLEQVREVMESTAASMGMLAENRENFNNIKVAYENEVIDGSDYFATATYTVKLGNKDYGYVFSITADLEAGTGQAKFVELID